MEEHYFTVVYRHVSAERCGELMAAPDVCVGSHSHMRDERDELKSQVASLKLQVEDLERRMASPAAQQALTGTMEPGRYAVLHYSAFADGDYIHTIAELQRDGRWVDDENGRPLIEYHGDKILRVWPLTGDSAYTLPEGFVLMPKELRHSVEIAYNMATLLDNQRLCADGYEAMFEALKDEPIMPLAPKEA
ncbi:hypothetical protein HNP46_000475 [Pseudomonas nitritireducens]|uniref:Uncharacterized protein n=1 Tax=Pseudomonas nitroreducens TaxID=46680 RepID=A0A7W7NZJ5_PSENT|nr:hypothetical protein [Pseudomonas nitritireducens]MBB4861664.1 hypothetical protein [Pseudomonas nitritireducens]